MNSDLGISVSEAAQRLRVDPSRVRAMIRSGQLEAQKLADIWIIDPASLERREVAKPPRGRPFSARNAWALLLMEDGSKECPLKQSKLAKELSPWAFSRARARAKNLDMPSLAPRLRCRAYVERLRAHPSDLERIESEPHVVRAGVSAARDHGIDIVAPGEIELYIQAKRQSTLKRKYHLEPSSRPNVILRVVDEPWPFPSSCKVAPPAVVALDLLETDDEESQHAAKELLAQLAAR